MVRAQIIVRGSVASFVTLRYKDEGSVVSFAYNSGNYIVIEF
jgi:hypothetical protein